MVGDLVALTGWCEKQKHLSKYLTASGGTEATQQSHRFVFRRLAKKVPLFVGQEKGDTGWIR